MHYIHAGRTRPKLPRTSEVGWWDRTRAEYITITITITCLLPRRARRGHLSLHFIYQPCLPLAAPSFISVSKTPTRCSLPRLHSYIPKCEPSRVGPVLTDRRGITIIKLHNYHTFRQGSRHPSPLHKPPQRFGMFGTALRDLHTPPTWAYSESGQPKRPAALRQNLHQARPREWAPRRMSTTLWPQ